MRNTEDIIQYYRDCLEYGDNFGKQQEDLMKAIIDLHERIKRLEDREQQHSLAHSNSRFDQP